MLWEALSDMFGHREHLKCEGWPVLNPNKMWNIEEILQEWEPNTAVSKTGSSKRCKLMPKDWLSLDDTPPMTPMGIILLKQCFPWASALSPHMQQSMEPVFLRSTSLSFGTPSSKQATAWERSSAPLSGQWWCPYAASTREQKSIPISSSGGKSRQFMRGLLIQHRER